MHPLTPPPGIQVLPVRSSGSGPQYRRGMGGAEEEVAVQLQGALACHFQEPASTAVR